MRGIFQLLLAFVKGGEAREIYHVIEAAKRPVRHLCGLPAIGF